MKRLAVKVLQRRIYAGGSLRDAAARAADAWHRAECGEAVVSQDNITFISRAARKTKAERLLQRIVIDPTICVGKPTIRGHRLWVSLILDRLAGGQTVDELLADYPGLKEADIRACIAYGAKLARKEEAALAERVMSGEVWRGVDDRTKLKALRRAARVGLDDIKAGRYTVIRNDEDLRRLFDGLAKGTVSRRRNKPGQKPPHRKRHARDP